MDFSENYLYMILDEAQGFPWTNDCCTMHLVLYFEEDGVLQHRNFCILSDDLVHDVLLVYATQQLFRTSIQSNSPQVTEIEYFTDGCYHEPYIFI